MTSSHLKTKVKFQIEHNARKGETVWVVGETPLGIFNLVSFIFLFPLTQISGSWHISSAIQLTGESPVWSCTLDIVSQSSISYKYFLRTTKNSMSAFRWENGANRTAKIFGTFFLDIYSNY